MDAIAPAVKPLTINLKDAARQRRAGNSAFREGKTNRKRIRAAGCGSDALSNSTAKITGAGSSGNVDSISARIPASQGSNADASLSGVSCLSKRRGPLWGNSIDDNHGRNGFTSLLPLAADNTKVTNFPLQDFGSCLQIKPDGATKSLLVCPTGYIYSEMYNRWSKPASEFLATIAEPVSRPENVQEFQITIFSLYAAVGVGISVDDIIRNLDAFSKNVIPECLERAIREHGGSFGRVKLVLRDSRYYLEAPLKEDLFHMFKSKTIEAARTHSAIGVRHLISRLPQPTTTQSQSATRLRDTGLETTQAPTLDPSTLGFKLTEASDPAKSAPEPPPTIVKELYSAEISAEKIGIVKESALNELKRPLVFEYDFRRDERNPSLNIALRASTKIRYYQERALRKMFSNGRARSGIIVLPCGAGKTLTGITAATTIRKSTMVLTSSPVAVDQWRRSFLEFTSVDKNCVVSLTSDQKKDLPEDSAGILISTYTMMSYTGKRSVAADRVLRQIRDREWGLLIFDEVQFAPAPAFRKVNDLVKSHCKLGLTATLVREDDLIHDLQWLIGPKLYEANWLELQEAGYLAKVQVSEVWCPMAADYYREYLNASHAQQRKLWVCNPNKLRVCEYLLRFHEARNDKVIVFSDNLFALKEVAFALKKPFISGEVGMNERMLILNKFKSSNKLNTICLSKVGDNAIDIPCANVVIQISFNFASRRQEAQRLGRILRPKPKGAEEFNAFFYSLVSKDTQEVTYADKRQQFIIDQGYAYKVLPLDVFPMESETLVFDDPARQRAILDRILASNNQSADLEDDDVILNDSGIDLPSVADGSTYEGFVNNDFVFDFPAGLRPASLAEMSGGTTVA